MAKTILLADDSVTIQKVVELTFMDEDYQILAVSDGTAALAKLDESIPDLVIADVHMPGVDGYEVCRTVKQRTPKVPVVLLVGTFEPFDAGQASSVGADGHLKKPFDSQDLLRLVEELTSEPAQAEEASAADDSTTSEPALTADSDDSFDLAAGSEDVANDDVVDNSVADSSVGDSEDATIISSSASFAPPEEFATREPAEKESSVPRIHALPDEPAAPADKSWSGSEAALVEDAEDTASDDGDLWASPKETAAEAASDKAGDVFGAADFAPPAASDSDSEETREAEAEAESGTIELVPESAVDEVAEESKQDEADTQETEKQILEAEAEVETAPAVAAANGNGHLELSDDDVERIAKRVAAILGDKVLHDVAWEVVPDLAELAIKERIRELESQVE